MRRIKLVLVAGIALLSLGCASTAGPFVTNISSDGQGGLVVEKCMVKFEQFTSTVSNDNCTSTTIILGEQSNRE